MIPALTPRPQAHPILLEVTLLRGLLARPGAHGLLHPEAHRLLSSLVLHLVNDQSGETGLRLMFPSLTCVSAPDPDSSLSSPLCVPLWAWCWEHRAGHRAHARPHGHTESRSGPHSSAAGSASPQVRATCRESPRHWSLQADRGPPGRETPRFRGTLAGKPPHRACDPSIPGAPRSPGSLSQVCRVPDPTAERLRQEAWCWEGPQV